MKKSIAAFLSVFLLFEAAVWAGLGSDKTLYVGGTVKDLKGLTEGKSSTADEKVFVFEYSGGKLEIPYDRVDLPPIFSPRIMRLSPGLGSPTLHL